MLSVRRPNLASGLQIERETNKLYGDLRSTFEQGPLLRRFGQHLDNPKRSRRTRNSVIQRRAGDMDTVNRPTPLRLLKEENVTVRQHRPPVIIYTHSPRPILVEVENFQAVVQRLTGRRRKRKAVDEEEPVHGEESSTLQPLRQFLDQDLHQEIAPRSSTSANKELLRGDQLVDGRVQMVNDTFSFQSSRGSPGLRVRSLFQSDFSEESRLSNRLRQLDSSATSSVSFSQLLSPLNSLTSDRFLSSGWTDGPTFLSPLSYQVVRQAKRTAANRPSSGSGPWNVSPGKMQGRSSWTMNDEWELQFDEALHSSGLFNLGNDT